MFSWPLTSGSSPSLYPSPWAATVVNQEPLMVHDSTNRFTSFEVTVKTRAWSRVFRSVYITMTVTVPHEWPWPWLMNDLAVSGLYCAPAVWESYLKRRWRGFMRIPKKHSGSFYSVRLLLASSLYYVTTGVVNIACYHWRCQYSRVLGHWGAYPGYTQVNSRAIRCSDINTRIHAVCYRQG